MFILAIVDLPPFRTRVLGTKCRMRLMLAKQAWEALSPDPKNPHNGKGARKPTDIRCRSSRPAAGQSGIRCRVRGGCFGYDVLPGPHSYFTASCLADAWKRNKKAMRRKSPSTSQNRSRLVGILKEGGVSSCQIRKLGQAENTPSWFARLPVCSKVYPQR